MGQKKSRYYTVPPLDKVVLRRITSATSFSPDEIYYFYYNFLQSTPIGYLTLTDFEKFYQTLFHHGAPENFARYVFNTYDTNRDGKVDFEEFIKGLYYTTKASSNEKIQWVFDLCDQDADHQLDLTELENIIQALYQLSDTDMSRVETYNEAMERVKQLFLTHQDHDTITKFNGITKSEFIDIVQRDANIMTLINSRPIINKHANKYENSTINSLKKRLKFKHSMRKSLSDSTLTATNKND